MATKLAPENINELSQQSLNACIQEVVVRQGVPAPASMEVFLLDRRLKDMLPTKIDRASLTKFLEVARPWSAQKRPFDVMDPRLADTAMQDIETARKFASKLSVGVIVPTLLQGVAGKETMRMLTDVLLTFFDELNDIDGADDSHLLCALEFVEVLRPLKALVSSSMESVAEAMSGLGLLHRHLGKAGTSLLCVVGTALKRAKWGADMLAQILGQEGAILSAHKAFAEHIESFESFDEAKSLSEQATVCAHACTDLTKFQPQVLQELLAEYSQSVLDQAIVVTKKLMTAMASRIVRYHDVEIISIHIREFSICFPHELISVGLEMEFATFAKVGRHDDLGDAVQSKCKELTRIAEGCVEGLHEKPPMAQTS